jgi:hypothetical protein
MRLAVSLLSALLLLGGCVVSSTLLFTEADIEDSINLLANPGFVPHSLMTDHSPPGWNIHIVPQPGEMQLVKIDPMNAHEGDSSLKISASGFETKIVSEPFPVRRYGGYYARIMIQSDSQNPPLVTLQMVTFKEDGKITNRFKKKEQSSDKWSRINVSAGFLRPGVTWGRISIIIPPFDDGAIWIDDAGCWEVHGFRID